MYTDNGIGILTNSDDISYYTSLTLGGKNFSVLVDTGQSPQKLRFAHFLLLLTLPPSDRRKVNQAFALSRVRTNRVSFPTFSSDLWVGGNVPGAIPSGQSTRVQYAVGDAGGPIEFADLDFLGYTVPSQAFSASLSILDLLPLTDLYVLKKSPRPTRAMGWV